MYMFFSTDFVGVCEILLIAWSCVIFGRFHKIAKLLNSRRPVLVTFICSTEVFLLILAVMLSTATKLYEFYFVAMATKFVF